MSVHKVCSDVFIVFNHSFEPHVHLIRGGVYTPVDHTEIKNVFFGFFSVLIGFDIYSCHITVAAS
jgi:hypothetical protein